MQVRQNSIKSSRRVARLNRYIVIVALLWIVATVALLLEARPLHTHAPEVDSGNHSQMSVPDRS